MNPRLVTVTASGARRPRRFVPVRARLRAARAVSVAVLLLGSGMAAAAPAASVSAVSPDLRQLDSLVRRGDADALARLQQAAGGYGTQAPHLDQQRYLRLLAQAYRDAGDVDAANAADGCLTRLATAQGDTVNAALGALGRVSQLLGQDPAAALAALGALDVRYAQVRDPEFIATVQRLYGDVYVALGQFDFGLGHYLKALELARAHPEFLSPSVPGLQLALARLYTYTHAPDKLLAMLPRADQEGAGLPPRSLARVYLYKGVAQAMLGHPARAREAYEQGTAVARAHGLLVMQADMLANIADSWLVERRYPEAERAAREAQDVARRAGDADALRVATANFGFALLGGGRLDEGLKVIEGVVAQLRAYHAWPDLADVLDEESRALERAGRAKDALAVLREREQIGERMAASEREKTVAVLQEQFNAQQRATQIEGLRRENLVKDREIQQRRVWQMIASGGAALALLLCGFVYRLYRRSQRTQRQLELLNTELEFHSTHDVLTGLLNRRSFRDRMQLRAERMAAAREALPAECFILLDIDHFKTINDRHGHGAGDEVLVEVARRLRDAVGDRGLVMRWGGEEFLVYVEAQPAAGHGRLVRALLDALAGTPVVVESGEALAITLTAGALSLPARAAGAGASPGWQQALALADHALYKGKQEGRNRAYLIDGAALGAGALRPELILPHTRARRAAAEPVT
jgi:diguanylate cyclase (GGDEF)-like protein